jgi:acyl transferase domain-containing protein
VCSADAIADSLSRQVCLPVRWTESIQKLISAGVQLFVEVGPGKVLCGLIRQIDRTVKTANVEDRQSLAQALDMARAVKPLNEILAESLPIVCHATLGAQTSHPQSGAGPLEHDLRPLRGRRDELLASLVLSCPCRKVHNDVLKDRGAGDRRVLKALDGRAPGVSGGRRRRRDRRPEP